MRKYFHASIPTIYVILFCLLKPAEMLGIRVGGKTRPGPDTRAAQLGQTSIRTTFF